MGVCKISVYHQCCLMKDQRRIYVYVCVSVFASFSLSLSSDCLVFVGAETESQLTKTTDSA